MDSFQTCSRIGGTGEALFKQWASPLVKSVQPVIGFENQCRYGDFRVIFNDNKVRHIEVKTEQTNTYNNFFLETYSNKNTARLGWLMTSGADLLWYLFLKDKRNFGRPCAYILNMPSLVEYWITGHPRFRPDVPQRKYDQHNSTWGCPVSIQSVLENVTHKIVEF